MHEATELLFVARQPIFDLHGKVWGYELFYRESMEAQSAVMIDEERSTLQVAASRLLLPENGGPETRCVINATPNFLMQGYAKGMHCERLVLSLRQAAVQDDSLLQAARELQKEGVLLGVTMEDCTLLDSELLRDIDLLECPFPVCVNCEEGQVASLRKADVKLLVSRLETHEQCDSARAWGAELLQGFYYQKPRTYSHKPFGLSVKHRLQILQLLLDERQDLEQLVEIIQGEVRLAVRLLSFANSAAFGLAHKVDSVRRAISIIGWNRIKNWLHLIVISDMASGIAGQELANTSAIRAKFLELLALESGREELGESLYLLGLFSLLEPLLEKPMAEILDVLRLPEDIAQALARQGGPLLPWLRLAEALESADWTHLPQLSAALDLDLHRISRCKLEALDWASSFFRDLK